jgi:hypothetical protein
VLSVTTVAQRAQSDHGHDDADADPPREQLLPAWRAAVFAYRRTLRETREDRIAWPSAYAAFREVLPDMPEAQAKHETTHAIAFAAANHTAWFWAGVYGRSGE